MKKNMVANNLLPTDLMTFSKATLASIAAALVVCSIAFSSDAMAMNVRRHAVGTAGASTKIRMEVDVPQSGAAGDPNALDILFVIDDSGSMDTHQERLKKNVNELIRAAQVAGVDIHAGVITTSVEGYSTTPWVAGGLIGPQKKFAATADGDFAATLATNLTAAMTTSGSGIEQPFRTVQLALSEPLASTENKGFLRPDAALAVFVLTDADDQSEAPMGSSAEFVSFLKGLKSGAPVAFHAAYAPTSDTTCRRDIGSEPMPVRIEEVLTAFGTLKESVSICDADFGTKLGQIGRGYSAIGLRTVQLKLAPNLSTMKVTYGTETFQAGDLLNGWVYDSSKMQLLFGEKINWRSQPARTQVVIEYLEK